MNTSFLGLLWNAPLNAMLNVWVEDYDYCSLLLSDRMNSELGCADLGNCSRRQLTINVQESTIGRAED